MFKSPVKGIQIKKSPINYIKTLVSPKQTHRTLQIQTNKVISTFQNQKTNDNFTKLASPNLLSIEVILDRPVRTIKLAFSFNSSTLIEELIAFLKNQIKDNFVYFKAKNVNLEYFLTLLHRKVKELGLKKIQVVACKIKIDRKGTFLNNLQIIQCLGTGGFSKVYLARGYGRLMAMKVINKNFIIENEKQNIVQSQRQILQKCNGHPFITQLYLSFETKNYLVFCMEYCNGGQLFNLLRKVRRMKQSEAKFYFLETLAAISHLHSQKILYRDLKPQNIIIDSEGHIRLADYGLSKIMRQKMTYSFCGSAEYMAPEMLLKKGHGFEVDYYCLGALLYELLIGLPPYYSRDQNQLFCNILNNQLQFPPQADLSQDLKQMLQRLLEKDTDLRFKKVSQILSCAWLKDSKIQDVLSKSLIPPFQTSMFENNFDNSDFVQDEQIEILKLQKEQDRGSILQNQKYFGDFDYIDSDFISLTEQIEKGSQKRLDFTKKAPQIVNSPYQRQALWRNTSMKSVDNSQIFLQNQAQHSPRVAQMLNRSNDKFKFQASQISALGQNSSIKASQIINNSKNENINSSGNKLLGAKSVPHIQKSQFVYTSTNDRFGSPVNINNYINIYTSKSPNYQINVNTNNFGSPVKKVLSFGNVSYDKNISNNSNSSNNGSTFKTSNIYSSINGERSKFSSIQKPILTAIPTNSSTTSIKSNIYGQNGNSLNNRGYLSNFKQRFNPNQKIKKSYKNNDKNSFNFFTASIPYKQA